MCSVIIFFSINFSSLSPGITYWVWPGILSSGPTWISPNLLSLNQCLSYFVLRIDGKNVKKLDLLCIASQNVKWCSHSANYIVVPQNLYRDLQHESLILLLNIYSKDLKVGTQTDICIPMFSTALFTIAKRWRQLNPSLSRSINKMWYIKHWDLRFKREQKSAACLDELWCC